MPRGSRKLTPILDCTLFGSVVDLPTSYAMIGGTDDTAGTGRVDAGRAGGGNENRIRYFRW